MKIFSEILWHDFRSNHLLIRLLKVRMMGKNHKKLKDIHAIVMEDQRGIETLVTKLREKAALQNENPKNPVSPLNDFDKNHIPSKNPKTMVESD